MHVYAGESEKMELEENSVVANRAKIKKERLDEIEALHKRYKDCCLGKDVPDDEWFSVEKDMNALLENATEAEYEEMERLIHFETVGMICSGIRIEREEEKKENERLNQK